MKRRPPRSTHDRSSAAADVYKTPVHALDMATHGQRFLSYSDGISEQFNELGEMFGSERLVDVFRGSLEGSLDEQRDRLMEALESFRGEAIIKERPAIHRGLPMIKIISMVAPLMGLLGTVTGMIIVFQAITIYGAGDPKAMAGGISSALITTVLGLIVAIPMMLLHAMLFARAKRILHVLEEQSAGIVAERAGR